MDVLRDPTSDITAKYRALYKLKETEGEEARGHLVECMGALDSVLLLHEVAFALGQRGDKASIVSLLDVLQDKQHNETTRHEAGEALGAIGDASALPVLEAVLADPAEPVPVRETCELAVERIKLLQSDPAQFATESKFSSVDPTPSFIDNTPPGCAPDAADRVDRLGAMLCDQSATLFDRYRCMFSLRNIGTPDAIRHLGVALVSDTSSALFRHEVAYVLGQLEVSSSSDDLIESLGREAEHPMVRHESAEALGSMATESVMERLRNLAEHKEPLVADSCRVALDMNEYWSHWQSTVGGAEGSA